MLKLFFKHRRVKNPGRLEKGKEVKIEITPSSHTYPATVGVSPTVALPSKGGKGKMKEINKNRDYALLPYLSGGCRGFPDSHLPFTDASNVYS
ncbi:hypothetical protein GX441_08890 [bacterium]|nr:hypothetical protein [bacterium]